MKKDTIEKTLEKIEDPVKRHLIKELLLKKELAGELLKERTEAMEVDNELLLSEVFDDRIKEIMDGKTMDNCVILKEELFDSFQKVFDNFKANADSDGDYRATPIVATKEKRCLRIEEPSQVLRSQSNQIFERTVAGVNKSADYKYSTDSNAKELFTDEELQIMDKVHKEINEFANIQFSPEETKRIKEGNYRLTNTDEKNPEKAFAYRVLRSDSWRTVSSEAKEDNSFGSSSSRSGKKGRKN